MNNAIITCNKCRLCKGRKNAVVGEGNINAKIVFVGEAPGAEEDKQGRPFVGRSGMFLNDLMRKCGFKRTDVWIGNIIKCRPPENRDPMVDEVRACRPYLDRQLDLINPKMVVTLGRFALEYFLPKEKISEVHGRPLRAKSRIIFPLYHPAAALRNEAIRKIMNNDFKAISDVLKKDIKNIPFPKSMEADASSDQLSLF
ncbi:uracil-DNA glycosylase [candidate division WWE3 bacterium CG10_big_fil_rev_8_21_14_0_10_32_10]|uniref:Type-4 uracil-DNA glycosylase n=1 Tax=candidate division WWE3 bacterium CG10_big_fil_rev_8_21_14_0_10_32_10 TaxID=1975090 RepID=A0A2H0R9P3_UNCKA|nr:MAG: uracil-DNA glycosylase [candidate division WWE3 bacterium CG10_big_fil_rev_8_21_14_0_10_32_10]